jgi:hypothetical protein
MALDKIIWLFCKKINGKNLFKKIKIGQPNPKKHMKESIGNKGQKKLL